MCLCHSPSTARLSAERRAAHAAGPLPARAPAADRHPRRLRHRAVRRLHRARRTAAPIKSCNMLAAQVGRRRDHHHRRPGRSRRHHAPDAGGVQGVPRPAVRLLHAGHGDERDRPVHAPPEGQRSRDPRAARRQPVPLHRLPEHRQGGADAASRRAEARPRPEGARHGCIRLRQACRTSASAVRRKEDYRFLTGAGQYTDDITLADQTLRRLRALAARARAHQVDRHRRGRRRCPACVGIFTGKDIDGKMGGLPCGWLITNTDGTPMKEPPHPVLAQGKVRYVGDHVAMVVAETLEQAQERRRAVEVDYDVLPAVVERARRRQDAAARPCTTRRPTTSCYNWALGDKAAVDAAFAKAAHVTKLDLVNNRLIPNAIEPRAAIGSYNRADRRVHAVRLQPEPARRAPADDGLRAGPARAQGARDRARRRRRLRLQDLPVRRRRVR